ncbi:hypothetical protein B0T22DRAFT_113622 [Podospora appendiculata]|uniref:Uncharacterized protein n=1 Tax=Podospora appendiculata TaxID=314037 RepID=A0AAE1CIJ7_9PEZI|nr:hypothetical protein B0T22DRAFT_113622 [Podospora appendiculata]
MDTTAHDDSTSTTSDYESGASEGVDYQYEGQTTLDRQITTTTTATTTTRALDKSPGRKKSPRGRTRAIVACTCACARKASELSDDHESADSGEDTDVELPDNSQRLTRPGRPRAPRPGSNGGGSETRDSRAGSSSHSKKSKAGAGKKAEKRTPYIEEYPDEPRRPVIILKEHKLPRRSSASDAKRVPSRDDRDYPEDHPLLMSAGPSSNSGSGSRGRSPATAAKRSRQSPATRQPTTTTAHPPPHPRRPDFTASPTISDSDLSDSEPEPLPIPKLPLPRRRRSAHDPEDEPEIAATIIRSSAWPQHEPATYSSSWPLQSGTHYPTARQPQPQHRASPPPPANNNNNIFHTSPPPLRSPHLKPRPPRAPRRPIARTIVSKPSMPALDRAARSSLATNLCDIWRGRPEDWESPYSSEFESEDDDDFAPPRMRLLEGTPPHEASPSVFSRPSRSRSRGGMGMRMGVGFLREASPLPTRRQSTRSHDEYTHDGFSAGGNGFLIEPPPPPREPSLAPSTRSRWTVRRYSFPESEPAAPPPPPPPPMMRGGGGGGGYRRAMSPVYSAARRTREFLSPVPMRAARFDFDAWGCARGSFGELGVGRF